MNIGIFDLETDGLYADVTKIHILVIKDFETGVKRRFGPNIMGLRTPLEPLNLGLTILKNCKIIVGHNILDYDIPVIKKLHPGWSTEAKKVDTLVCVRVIWANIRETDFSLHRKGVLEAKNIGRHSLDAWGQRIKLFKGTYGKTTDWKVYDDEMGDYCELDVDVTDKLYHLILKKAYPESVLQMEHDIHQICLDQTRYGFPFDVAKANKLLAKLQTRKAELHSEIYKALGPYWIVNLGETVSKKTIKYKDPTRASQTVGSSWTKIKIVEFNPNSRAHLAKQLQEKFGWKPTAFGEDGIPNIDDDILEAMIKDFPIAKSIQEFLMIQKRVGQLAEGKQAWLSVEVDGLIHGRVNTMGAITCRCTHSDPNLAQIPSNDAPYGHECRELFRAPQGWKQFGSDVAGLELRMLAHYMFPWDQGAYGEIILNGDIHTANQQAAGLPTRGNAKTFIYGFLYGAGDEKIGSIVNGDKKRGKQLKEQFLKNTPALKKLREAVALAVSTKGVLKTIDGRFIPVRHAHAALNTLLQSAGAIVCKMWVIRFHEILREQGFIHGIHFKQAAYVHDEIQIHFDPKVLTGARLGDISLQAIQEVGIKLGIRLPLATDWKEGLNYAECH